jgi:predicted dehydrogenase
MPSPIHLAVIGYGLAGRVFHAPLIGHTPGLALHSVVTSQHAVVSATLPGVRVCATAEEVFDDQAVDAVVIATPNALHAPLALAALQAGKHVLVDKPFALDALQAEALVSVAEANDRVVTVFQNRRFDADFLTLQALLARGTLGDIAECHVHFDRFRPQVRDRWREQAGPGSGLWYDLGPHLLDQMLMLFGCPRAISVDTDCQRGTGGVDWFHAVLHYPRMRAVLHAGSLVAAATPRFAVHGRRGSWVKHGRDVQEAQLAAGRRPGDADWGLDPQPGLLTCVDTAGGLQEAPLANLPGDYRAVYEGFASAIHGKTAPVVTAEQALLLMRLLDAGQLSAREGRRIAL